jgi:hypothetical protein
MLLSASKEMPLVNAASPHSATMCSVPPDMSRATAMPSAALSAVPGMSLRHRLSCSLSVSQHEAVQPARLADGLEVVVARPVSILWT